MIRTSSSAIQAGGDSPAASRLASTRDIELVGLHARIADRSHLLGVRENDLGHDVPQ
jgi:hypothetical protein